MGLIAYDTSQEERAFGAIIQENELRFKGLRCIGRKILRDHYDGPHADVVVEPPLYVLLNLCAALFGSVDVMWMLIRRGMAEVRPSEKRGMHCPTCSLEGSRTRANAGSASAKQRTRLFTLSAGRSICGRRPGSTFAGA